MCSRLGTTQKIPMVLLAFVASMFSGFCAEGTFTLAWSEYPSWSTFGVAQELKIIDHGNSPIEKKWGVKIELKEADYDTCITQYGSNKCDAVCITNMDVLNPSLSRASVAVMPTSTSFGADALLVTAGIKTVADLKGKKVFGLEKSVSEYCFDRNIEIAGEKPADYKFVNMDPSAAALAMQQKQGGYDAIIVWNPFVLDTLNKRPDVHVLFDSTKIPNEIIDMVVVGQDVLDKPKGRAFACAVIEVYYEINKRLADPATRNDTLKALGEKFSHLDVAGMAKACEQTKFYKTADEGIAIYTGKELKDVIMPKVVTFCTAQEITPKGKAVKIEYGPKTGATDLRFDPTLMQEVKDKK